MNYEMCYCTNRVGGPFAVFTCRSETSRSIEASNPKAGSTKHVHCTSYRRSEMHLFFCPEYPESLFQPISRYNQMYRVYASSAQSLPHGIAGCGVLYYKQ